MQWLRTWLSICILRDGKGFKSPGDRPSFEGSHVCPYATACDAIQTLPRPLAALGPSAHVPLTWRGLRVDRTGWGFVSYQGHRQLHAAHGPLALAEVFDGEVVAARKAAQWAEEEWYELDPPATGLHLCIDTTAVIRGLLGHPSDNSQADFLAFHDTITRIRPPSTSIQWAPGHKDIAGNEAADAQAKLGAAQHPDTDGGTMTLTHLKRTMKRERKALFA